MQPGIWQILIVAIVVLVLFGRGRISEMMGDFGKGINSFKKGMNEERNSSDSNPQIEASASSEAPSATADSAETASTGDKSAS